MLMHSANHKFDRPGEAEASIQKRRSNNYSQVSDGAAAVLLMKRSIAMQKALPILRVFREYSGPSLSYYINNFKPMKVVQASAHLPQILCCYSGLDNFFLSFGDRYNSPEDNVNQLGMVIAEAEGHHNVENALGIHEWLESKGHQYIVTPEKEGPDCGYSGDVWYPQPTPKDHLWRYMPNQAMTPHILGLPLMHRILRYVAKTKDMLDRYFKGEDFPAFGLQVLIS
ncbi:hypothetical protein KY284_012702 [Solanum tuberosum]|nr:hypothetical protein KY284_012702 [Solanum tuberosum]